VPYFSRNKNIYKGSRGIFIVDLRLVFGNQSELTKDQSYEEFWKEFREDVAAVYTILKEAETPPS
jgi:hypothetical protein